MELHGKCECIKILHTTYYFGIPLSFIVETPLSLFLKYTPIFALR